MPKGETEDLLLFIVAKAHWVATLNRCHRDVGHQDHDHTCWGNASGGLEWLNRCKSLKSCIHCLWYEGNLPKVPLHPIMATAPMDLLHVDFTSIEMTMELDKSPRVVSFLVFQDHFMKHIMVYMTPNQTAKTVTKFLYQGYISIFGVLARLLSD